MKSICGRRWHWRGKRRRRARCPWAASSCGRGRSSGGDATGGRKSSTLDECTLYVTLEPCPMCAGAILNARIPRVYYGARDREMGACGGVLNLFMEDFPTHPALVGGVLEAECRGVLSDFFRRLRRI